MRRFNFDLAPGELFDLGLNHYGEFVCSVETAEEFLHGGMVKVDGKPGTLAVIERFENAVQLRWVFSPERVPTYGNPLG
jgi:hypothetical protein